MRYILPLLLLAAGSPLVAAGKDDPQTKGAPVDPDAMRCRAVRDVASRIPERVCKTNAEWKKEEEAARAAMEARNRASSCGGNAC
ncbi:hypothetical protein WBP07_09325 [Novosphingobium sp. BL-8A]|uniref:hypothetical protein n=1 Tax=Novosphingobium sp. BL-8A TaxID=3127639 RepID=UPI0037575542